MKNLIRVDSASEKFWEDLKASKTDFKNFF